MAKFGDLPTYIIHKILELMPIQDAARSSTLSEKCRQIWSTLPHLVFNGNFFRYVSNKGASAASIIHKVLMQHTGPILGFHLISCVHKLAPSDLDQCIIFVSKHSIENITIHIVANNEKYSLPRAIFTSSTLIHLKLTTCAFKLPPPAFSGFNKLISLELCNVSINSKFLESLISHCPLLEQLILHYISCDVIEITAPILRSLDIHGIRSICLKNIPHLAKLSLECAEYLGAAGQYDIAKLFKSFSFLEHLCLDYSTLKFLATGTVEIPTRLPFELNSVKFLRLSGIYMSDLDVVSCALCLIRSFLYLQCLEIQVDDYDDEIPALECLEVERFSNVTFNHLREVKLDFFIGSKPEMQLIYLLVAKSPVLVRMLIDIGDEYDDPINRPYRCLFKIIKLQAMISGFQRASCNAEVIIDNVEALLSNLRFHLGINETDLNGWWFSS